MNKHINRNTYIHTCVVVVAAAAIADAAAAVLLLLLLLLLLLHFSLSLLGAVTTSEHGLSMMPTDKLKST